MSNSFNLYLTSIIACTIIKVQALAVKKNSLLLKHSCAFFLAKHPLSTQGTHWYLSRLYQGFCHKKIVISTTEKTFCTQHHHLQSQLKCILRISRDLQFAL